MRVFFNGSFKRKTTAMDASCDHVANTISIPLYQALYKG